MKYKYLTKEQIIISLDRLTRFKNTREKYLRVFSDILVACLIEPKLKKSDIENLDFAILTDYVSEILNSSIELLSPKPIASHQGKELEILSSWQTSHSLLDRKYINLYLKDYENSIFINDDETQKLLDNKIDYLSALELFPDDCPLNLRWLKEMTDLLKPFKHITDLEFQKHADKISKQVREEKKIKFPIEEILLVEGITEEILLPVFAQKLGYDFYASGIQIIPAGGKNQVVKMYYKLANELKIPIFVLLDKDAEDNINQIKPRLREQDKIHLVSCGEFEDLLPKSLIVRTVNSHFKNFLMISENDLIDGMSTVKVLEEIFKTKGLHEFKKAEFAKLVKDNITSNLDISSEIMAIIEEIRLTNKMLDTEFCS